MELQSTKSQEQIGAGQGALFPQELEIRDVLARVLKRCPKKRNEIAKQLSTLAGWAVSENMLNDWCSLSRKGLRFPLSLVNAVCEITGTDDLAFLAMRDSLRERAQLGARAVELRSLLNKMATEAEILAARKQRGRGVSRSKRGM